MTTVAELAASGRGSVAYALEVPGLGVFTSIAGWYPRTATYGESRHYPWIIFDSLPSIREQVDPLDGSIDVEDITIEIADVAGGMTALVRDWRAGGYSYLSLDLTAAATAAAVDDVSWATLGGGTVWCEREACTYATTGSLVVSAVTYDALTGLTRGALGTTAALHDVDWDADPPRRPLVTDAPHVLVGRRCLLWQAVEGADGSMGAATCIYRGRIVGYRTGRGMWRLEIEHISAVFCEEVCGSLPSIDMHPGYWYAGTTPNSALGVKVVVSGAITQRTTTTIDSGYYWYGADLASQWNAQMRAEGFTLEPQLAFAEDRWHLVCSDADANAHLLIDVHEGEPLWALGFDAGSYIGEDNTAFEAKAQREPMACVIDFSPDGSAYPELRCPDPDQLTIGCYVMAPGQPVVQIVSTADYYGRVLLSRDLDLGLGYGRPIWAIKDASDLVLQHVVAIGTYDAAATVRSALQTLLAQGTGDEPDTWFPRDMEAADLAHLELDAALATAPALLAYINRLVVTEPTKLWDLIGPHLGLLGIFPRVTTDGKVGFARLTTPVPSALDEVEVDSAMWSLDGAIDIESRIDHVALVNSIIAEHSYDYAEQAFSTGRVRITWDDGLNSLGKTRSIGYPLRGTCLNRGYGAVTTETELAEAIRSQVTATHFGAYGRAASVLEIPATWVSRQLLCGDYVAVTHSLAPDVVEGVIGVTSRAGLVVGRSLSLTGRDRDTLLVQLYPDGGWAGIAPCVRCTAYSPNRAALQITTSDAYAQTGATDLDWLSTARLPATALSQSYSVETYAATTVVVTSISGAWIMLQSDAYSTGFPAGGAWLTLPGWDSADTWQQRYAYHAGASTVPTLGTTGDDAREWTI